MKNRFTLFTVTLITLLSLKGICQTNTFLRAYGGRFSDYIQTLDQTHDKGFFLGGSTASYGPNKFNLDQNVYLIKTDSFGNTEWSKTYNYDTLYVEETIDIIERTDSTYLMLGNVRDQGQGNLGFYLAEINEAGDVKWSRAYNLNGFSSMATCITKMFDGFLIGGAYDNAEPHSRDALLLKVSPDGNPLWIRTYQTDTFYADVINKVSITDDNNLLLTGFSFYNLPHDYRAMVIKTDINGNLKWNKVYANSNDTRCIGFYNYPDGSYLFAGQAARYGQGADDFMLLKTDTAGKPLWMKVYGNENLQFANDMIITDDGPVIAGLTYSSTFGRAYLIQTDFNGALMHSYEFGDTMFSQSAKRILQTNKGFVIAGEKVGSFFDGYSAEDFTFTGVNPDFTIPCLQSSFLTTTDNVPIIPVEAYYEQDTIEILSEPFDFTVKGGVIDTFFCQLNTGMVAPVSNFAKAEVYPNPSTGKITIQLTEALGSNYTLTITDVMGREMQQLATKQVGSNAIELNTSLSAGLYFFNISTKGSEHAIQGKFIVNR